MQWLIFPAVLVTDSSKRDIKNDMDLRDVTALVVGAGGFLGRYLCRALLDAGAIVRGVSLEKPVPDRFHSLDDEVAWYIGDFSDERLMRGAIDGADIVFHLACTTLPATSNEDLIHDISTNVFPTIQLLRLSIEYGIERVVFISSGGTVYGIPREIPITETHETNPICGYGIHKLAIEKYLHLFFHLYGLDYRVLRLSNPYGVDQVASRQQGVIGAFIYNAIHHQSLDVWGDGTVVRDFIHIDDVMNAFLSAAVHAGPSKVFNIGSGFGHSVTDVVDIIRELWAGDILVRYGESRNVDVPVNILDVGRAQLEFSWRPDVSLSQGIKSIVDAYITTVHRSEYSAK